MQGKPQTKREGRRTKSSGAKVTGKQQDRSYENVTERERETGPRKITRSTVCCVRPKNCASGWDYHPCLKKSGFVFQEVIIYSANGVAPMLTLRNLYPLNNKHCISETIISEI